MDEQLTSAPELARQLGVEPKRLRDAIRENRLVPDHQHGKRYRLDSADVERIKRHPAVQETIRRARR